LLILRHRVWDNIYVILLVLMSLAYGLKIISYQGSVVNGIKSELLNPEIWKFVKDAI